MYRVELFSAIYSSAITATIGQILSHGAVFNQSQHRRVNNLEDEASRFFPKSFQEWPSFKKKYSPLTKRKVTPRAK